MTLRCSRVVCVNCFRRCRMAGDCSGPSGSSGSTGGCLTVVTCFRWGVTRSDWCSEFRAWIGRRSSPRSSAPCLSVAWIRASDPSSGRTTPIANSIYRLIEPVVIEPLRRDFEETKGRVTALLAEDRRITARDTP